MFRFVCVSEHRKLIIHPGCVYSFFHDYTKFQSPYLFLLFLSFEYHLASKLMLRVKRKVQKEQTKHKTRITVCSNACSNDSPHTQYNFRFFFFFEQITCLSETAANTTGIYHFRLYLIESTHRFIYLQLNKINDLVSAFSNT